MTKVFGSEKDNILNYLCLVGFSRLMKKQYFFVLLQALLQLNVSLYLIFKEISQTIKRKVLKGDIGGLRSHYSLSSIFYHFFVLFMKYKPLFV